MIKYFLATFLFLKDSPHEKQRVKSYDLFHKYDTKISISYNFC